MSALALRLVGESGVRRLASKGLLDCEVNRCIADFFKDRGLEYEITSRRRMPSSANRSFHIRVAGPNANIYMREEGLGLALRLRMLSSVEWASVAAVGLDPNQGPGPYVRPGAEFIVDYTLR
mgnify:CR=1 FL=1